MDASRATAQPKSLCGVVSWKKKKEKKKIKAHLHLTLGCLRFFQLAVMEISLGPRPRVSKGCSFAEDLLILCWSSRLLTYKHRACPHCQALRLLRYLGANSLYHSSWDPADDVLLALHCHRWRAMRQWYMTTCARPPVVDSSHTSHHHAPDPDLCGARPTFCATRNNSAGPIPSPIRDSNGRRLPPRADNVLGPRLHPRLALGPTTLWPI